MSLSSLSRRSRFLVVCAAALALAAGAAEARVGGGKSFGSRGSRTYDAAPSTTTAPRQAQPIERSMTQPSQAAPGMNQASPMRGAPAAAAAKPGFFSGGFGKALLGGLIGAGIFGLLSGSGLFGGLSGLGSILGLLLQAGLIVGIVMLAVRFFRSRQAPQPAMAGAGAGGPMPRSALGGLGLAGGLGGSSAGADAPRPAAAPGPSGGDAVGITPDDFNAFEKALHDIQLAYGREDIAALRAICTPEMISFFSEDLAENAKAGVVNKLSDPKLLQGDLAEAWREDGADYATVAMRFSLIDVREDRATGRVVDGDPAHPVEATELWTFRRANGGAWQLSAIQQA